MTEKTYLEKFIEKDLKQIRKKGFKYIGPVKNSYGHYWFKSPDNIRTIGGPVHKHTKTGFRRVAWDFGKRWGRIACKYVHGVPNRRK